MAVLSKSDNIVLVKVHGGGTGPVARTFSSKISLRREYMWKQKIWKVIPLTIHAVDLRKCSGSPVQLAALTQLSLFPLQPFANLFH